AVAQIRSAESMEKNLSISKDLVRQASKAGAQAIFFPEASDYICSNTKRSLELCQSVEQSVFVQGLQEQAKEYVLSIAVGIHEPSADIKSKRVRNTLIWISDTGEVLHRYQKVHMLEMNLLDGPKIQESNFCEPGESILPPFETPVGQAGAMICFDLRFPSLAQKLVSMGAEVLIYPSAFVPDTGKIHWIPLLQARAIECQAYVIAPDQVGQHNEKRSSYGHSVVIDPWGRIIAQLGSEENVLLYADIDPEQIRLARQSLRLRKRE
ncbi:carbon-nitrogen hydrolase, partial [Bipolaris maydis]